MAYIKTVKQIKLNMDYANATHAQLSAAGFTITVMKSQAKKRRRSKWVRPAINSSCGYRISKIGDANEPHRGVI